MLTAPTHEFRTRTFGSFTYKSAPRPGCPEAVRIDPDWVRENLVECQVPQLAALGIRHSVTCHYKAVAPLQRLWAAWERAGLLPLLKTFDGLWVARYKRQPGSEAERAAACVHLGPADLSNHSWGTAFDVNAAHYPLGHAIDPADPFTQLFPVAEAEGWFQGAHFVSRPDPMHFELAAV